MVESRDVIGMIEDPAFLGGVEQIYRALVSAQQPAAEDAPVLSASSALDALHFVIAMLQEASPANGMPRALRLAAEQSRSDIHAMMRMMRDYKRERGQHMLETIGGRIQPNII